MAEMTMIEDGNCNIKWECSNCKALIKDKAGFEDKVKHCPKCKEPVTKFIPVFDDFVDSFIEDKDRSI